jgi:HEPN domain-containing protein
MPPEERLAPDDPRAWLRVAQEDLALAGARVSGVGFALLCFHAQQAAEKAVKAVLLRRQVRFPYTHDIGHLLDLCRSAGVSVPHDVTDADMLTDFATISRYPGVVEVDAQDHDDAVTTARAVLDWATAVLESGKADP